MCGIVYFNNKSGQSVSGLVRGAYKAQRSRGHEGFGFFTPNNNRLTHNTGERDILRMLNRTKQSEILFHHRYPTSTANVRNACHPFSSKNEYKNNYVMVHNGVIWNDDLVAIEQAKDGINYVSKQIDGRFNDSEVLLYDLADVIEGRKEKLTVEGSIAFVMVQLDKKGNRKALFFGRNSGSPLKITKYPNGFSITSEGEGVMVDSDKLFKYEYKTGKFTSTDFIIPDMTFSYKNYNDSEYESYGRGDYLGYDTGYTWNNRGNIRYNKDGKRIDNQGFLLPDMSKHNVFTEDVLEAHKNNGRYGLDDDGVSDKNAVAEIKGALLYDMNYSAESALEFGEYILETMQTEYAQIEDAMQTDDKIDDRAIDTYLELDEKIRLLTITLNQMTDNQLLLALTANGKRNLTV